jgi:hypothetical protein
MEQSGAVVFQIPILTATPFPLAAILNLDYMRSLIIKFGLILLVAELLSWWILFYSPLNIPTYITVIGTPLNILGLFLIVLLAVVLYFFQRRLLLLNKEFTVVQLAFWSTVVALISEFLFQIIRLPTINADSINERLYYALRGTLVIPVFAFIISLLIATMVKRKGSLKSMTNGS